MRVVVDVALLAQEPPGFLEPAQDRAVRVEDLEARVVGNQRRKAATVVYRADQLDPRGLADPLVVLAEAGCQMHDSGSVLGRDEVASEHAEGVRVILEVREERPVVATDQLGAEQLSDLLGRPQLALELAERTGTEQHPPPVGLDEDVGELGADRQRQVRRQRPGRRGPSQDVHGHRRVTG